MSRYMQGKDYVGRRDSTKKWSKWENNLPDQVEVPRSLAVAVEEIRQITLHSFGDAGTRRSKGTSRQRRSYYPQT